MKQIFFALILFMLVCCCSNENDENMDLPKVQIDKAVQTSLTTLTLQASVISSTSPVKARGLCWIEIGQSPITTDNPNFDADPTIKNDTIIEGSGIGTFTFTITGLKEKTLYHINAYAINDEGVGYGETAYGMWTEDNYIH